MFDSREVERVIKKTMFSHYVQKISQLWGKKTYDILEAFFFFIQENNTLVA